MIKKIDIAGIQLDNYPAHEAIMQMERCMVEDTFFTVEEITADMLIQAEKSERLREAFLLMTHTVIGETGVLEAAGINSIQRRHETEHHVFFYEFIKRLERNHRKVFLLGMQEEKTENFQTWLTQEYPRMEFAGVGAAELCMGDWDAIVNEINAATPDVVVSILPTPEEENFLLDHRNKISARLWYGMGNVKFQEKKHRFRDFFYRRHQVRTLEQQMNHYEGENKEKGT